ncbi:MAG TPA: ribosome silencing factor, partial [Acidocella sp.]|nr:ribosome silencing factor [Acidocella sp.]
MPGTPRKKAAIAGPKGKKAAPKQPVEQLERLQALIVATLEDDKAEDIVALDLAGRASFADRMIIATGLADRQISAMATHLHEKLHEAGFRKPLTEGANGTDWVLIDAG